VLKEVAAANAGMEWRALDVEDGGKVRTFAAETAKDYPGLNVLINNAGIKRPENLKEQAEEFKAVEAMITTNVLGPMRLTAALMPHLLSQEHAAVINVSSGLAFFTCRSGNADWKEFCSSNTLRFHNSGVMKTFYWFVAALCICGIAHAETLIPDKADPALAEVREKAFLPWVDASGRADEWHRLASSNIPVYNERKPGNISRSLYIPNPGVGYWSLDNLSEKDLWKTQHEKLKIGDELVSATQYTNERGELVYWALWASAERSYLIKDKMRALGVVPAKVELNLCDNLKVISAGLEPFTGIAIFATLGVCVIGFLGVILLMLLSRRTSMPVKV